MKTNTLNVISFHKFSNVCLVNGRSFYNLSFLILVLISSNLLAQTNDQRAEDMQIGLQNNFMSADQSYYKNNSSTDNNPYGYGYWVAAHALENLADAYQRTRNTVYRDRMKSIIAGIRKYNNYGPGTYHNDYYDDLEWLCLATFNCYNATKDPEFLDAVHQIWAEIKTGYSNGVMSWRKGCTTPCNNSIANSPAIVIAVKLYQLEGDATNLQMAKDIHAWMKANVFNANGGIWDAPGNFNDGWQFSYNSGMFIAACLELSLVTGQQSYVDDGIKACEFMMNYRNYNGGVFFLNETGQGDGGLFKGIFAKYFIEFVRLGNLTDAQKARYLQEIYFTANYAWNNAVNKSNFLISPDWSKLPSTSIDLSTEVSGVHLFESVASLNKVHVYQNINYSGFYSQLPVGSYTLAQLQARGVNDNDISSLSVPKGYVLTVFVDDNFSGTSATFTSNTGWIGTDLNDKVSSLIISPAPPPTNGLTGNYYNGMNFETKVYSNIDPTINFDWGSGSPDASVNVDGFSVRWTGQIQPKYSETYTFYINSDNGRRLWINNQLIIDKWIDDWGTEYKGTITLSAGVKYDITLEYFENNGGANCKMEWSSASQVREVVPQSQLFPNMGGGDGLTANYFNGKNFETPVYSSIDPSINFDWGSGSPNASVNADAFSVRWAGQILPKYSETYTFYINSDNGRRLWINNQLIIDKWISDFGVEYKGTITLAAGQKYDIKLEYFEDFGGASCKLEWSSPSQARQVVLQSQLYSTITTAPWQMKQAPLMTDYASLVDPLNTLPEYPRPQLQRTDWLNLNGVWQFKPAAAGEALPKGNLPQSILVPFPEESAISGIMSLYQRIWYKRQFTVPSNWTGKNVILNFGAVDWECEVFVNDVSVGIHQGGYDPFSFNITNYIKGTGPQTLTVRVYDPTDQTGGGYQPVGKQSLTPSGFFYTSVTGIWQTVWLEPVNPVSIKDIKITPDIDAKVLRLTVNVNGNASGVSISAKAKNGTSIVSSATGAGNTEFTISIPNPHLWSPVDPFLYDLEISLMNNGTEVDNVKSYFGMRKVNVDLADGFKKIIFNNSPLFLNGLLDQGYWPDGLYTAPTDDALKSDLVRIKELGFNMVRKHIKVEPARWYYWADKLGLIVIQDMPSLTLSGAVTDAGKIIFKNELTQMVHTVYNYASVSMLVVFNESWGQHDTEALTQYVMGMDNTRIVNCASGWNHFDVGHIDDTHSYPAPFTNKNANQAVICGEYGGIGLKVAGHSWAPGQEVAYMFVNNGSDLNYEFNRFQLHNTDYVRTRGMSGAVYTQICDVEKEVNGLWTYDRKIFKGDKTSINASANIPIRKAQYTVITKTAQSWRYTTSTPASTWNTETFNDAAWGTGNAPFGTIQPIGTSWNSADIWMRRTFNPGSLSADQIKHLVFTVFHDEDAEIYINGVLAGKTYGYNSEYLHTPIYDAGLNAIRANSNNVIAVHCHQTAGLQTIDVGIDMMSAPAVIGNGDGLTGNYFNGMNFETPKFSRKDATISFDWANGSPDASVNADQFSARWTGQIQPTYSENYTFYVNSDNGRRLWINNQLIIDKWIDDWGIEFSGTIALTAGQKYEIKLEYFENNGGAGCKLEWSSASQVRQVVPQSQLYSNTLPVVSITSPVNNSTSTAPANLSLAVNTSDADGSVSKVDYYNGTNLIASTSSPFAYTWNNLAVGTYSITARATDNRGAVTVSAPVSVTVNPAMVGTVYQDCNYAGYAVGLAVGNYTLSQLVALGMKDNDLSSVKVQSGYEVVLYADDNFGGNSLVITSDNSCLVGNSFNDIATSVKVMKVPANNPPAVSITSPANNASFNAPASITFSANATDSDGSVSKVEYFNGSQSLGSATVSPFNVTWSNVAAGTYTLTAKATDNSNAVTTSSSISITVKTVVGNNPPSVSITAPVNNASFNTPASITFSANATDSDGSVSKVEYFNGSQSIGVATTSPYNVTWTNVASGTYTITAKATDNSSAVTTSAAITVTVKAVVVNNAPSVSITAPTNNASFNAPATISFSANATDSDGSVSKVEYFNGSQSIGVATASPFNVTWSNVAAGTYTITAKATDNSNATTTSSAITIVVKTVSTDLCSSLPQYVENGGYVDGSKVKNAGSSYQCKPYPYSGWCNGASWAYAPGTGAYWTDAWILVGSCTPSAPTMSSTTASFSPNPAIDYITINIGEISKVTITNTQGIIVLTQTVPAYGTVNVSSLSPGMYSIKIETSANVINTSLSKN